MSEKILRELVQRIKTTDVTNIKITEYCNISASEGGLNAENELESILAQKCTWRFSQHKGEKGRRIEAIRKLSQRRAILGIFEINSQVHFINAYTLNTRVQERLPEIEIDGGKVDDI